MKPEPRVQTPLSRREQEVAELVAEGMSNRAIAERLFLSERTIESHVENALNKLGLSSRTQLATWLVRQSEGPQQRPEEVLERSGRLVMRAICPVVVGREQEISRLEDALLAACRGEGNLVLLSGPAGIGKTRLVAELAHRAATVGATVMQGGCSEADLSLPFLPFLEAIGNHFAVADLARLGEQLGPARRELAQLFPQLGFDAATATALDGAQAKLRLFEAILALLQLAARPRGLLLAIEDLHWADASTRELLDYVCRRVRSRSLLVVATYRDDEVHRRHPLLPTIQGWRRARLADEVFLRPLPPEGVARMVSAIFDEPTRDDTRDFFHARSEGNPFVLEELLKVAIDSGDVYRTETGWARRALEEMRLPKTVRDSVLLRLDRLPDEHAEALRVAAVLGRSFDYALLRDVSGRDLDEELETFVGQQLVEEESGHPGRYRFRHALTQEAIYDSLPAPKRERLHRQAAEALRARTNLPAVELARHLLRAGLSEDARPLLIDAADQAERARAFRDAADLLVRALDATSDPTEKALLKGRIGEALWRSGDSAAAAAYLVAAVEAVGAAGRIVEAEHFRVIHARVLTEQNRHDLGRVEFDTAISALERLPPSRDLALALAWRSSIDVIAHRVAAAEPQVNRALEIAGTINDHEVRLWAMNYLGILEGAKFHYEEQMRLLTAAHKEAVARGFTTVAATALNNLQAGSYFLASPSQAQAYLQPLRDLGTEHALLAAAQLQAWTSLYGGELKPALDYYQRYLALAEQVGNPRHRQIAQRGLAHALIMVGRAPEAAPLMIRPNPTENLQMATEWCHVWALCYLALGDPHNAAEPTRETAAAVDADVLVRALPFVGEMAEALDADGDLATLRAITDAIRAAPAHADQPQLQVVLAIQELADGHAMQALGRCLAAAEVFRERGDRIDELRAHLLAARCHLARGEKDAARTLVSEAVQAARQMGDRYHEKPALDLAERLGLEPPAEAGAVPTEVGERLVTVLFADVRGYTKLSKSSPPSDLVDRIASLQRWAKIEIERRHGVVDKFAGDAVMATFNVSGVTVDHAQHALDAARALRDKARLLGLPLGIGLAVGPAIVGRLSEGANISVLGDATNLASRLQSAARAGEIVLSEEAQRRLHCPDAAPDVLKLKGFPGPVTAYRLPGRSA